MTGAIFFSTFSRIFISSKDLSNGRDVTSVVSRNNIFFPRKNETHSRKFVQPSRKLTDRRGKKRRCIALSRCGERPEGRMETGGTRTLRGAARIRSVWPISLSDVSNYVYVSTSLPPAPSPSRRCLITPRCRAPRSPQRDALAAAPAPASFVAGRRSLKSENNKIHLTPFTGYGPPAPGPDALPRSERGCSQKGQMRRE